MSTLLQIFVWIVYCRNLDAIFVISTLLLKNALLILQNALVSKWAFSAQSQTDVYQRWHKHFAGDLGSTMDTNVSLKKYGHKDALLFTFI